MDNLQEDAIHGCQCSDSGVYGQFGFKDSSAWRYQANEECLVWFSLVATVEGRLCPSGVAEFVHLLMPYVATSLHSGQ